MTSSGIDDIHDDIHGLLVDGIQLPTLKFCVTGKIVTDNASVVCNLEFGVPHN